MDAVVSERPRTVTVSVAILAVLLVVGEVMSLIDPPANRYANALAKAFPFYQYIQIVGAFGGTLLFAFFIYSIYKGKNWARILYLVFFILGALSSIPVDLGALQVSPEARIISGIRLVAMLVAMVLLFTSPGNLWFRRRLA